MKKKLIPTRSQENLEQSEMISVVLTRGEEFDDFGLLSAESYEPWLQSIVLGEIPDSFGGRWQHRISRIRDVLMEDLGQNFDTVLEFAERITEFFRARNTALAERFLDIDNKAPTMQPSQRKSMVDDFQFHMTSAATIENFLSERYQPVPVGIKNLWGASEFPDTNDLMIAVGLIWYFKACEWKSNDEWYALELLFESSDAISMTQTTIVWEEAFQMMRDTEVKNAASALATMRHAENNQLKEYAVEYWKKHIDPNLSAQKAATELLRANAVNLSHKKLAEIISAEKNKLK